MTEVEMGSTKTLSWTIPFDSDGWHLVLSRTSAKGVDSDIVTFALHWKGKSKVTHSVEGKVSAFRAMFRELGA